MALSGALRVQVGSEAAFPFGALCQRVEPELDFELRAAGAKDDQKRDKDTGERVWVVRAMDLDPKALEFGGSAEVKVKILAEHQPVPPAAEVPGYPPRVDFVALMATPYPNGKPCNSKRDKSGDCRARQAFSLRATGMVASAQPMPPPAGVDADGVVEDKAPASKRSEAA